MYYNLQIYKINLTSRCYFKNFYQNYTVLWGIKRNLGLFF